MDSSSLLNKIDDLDGSLDSLEDILNPILDDSLHTAAKKLPLLDRAKLNVTVVYAIESLLFSYLRVNGVNAREHEVFKELSRTKQYFDKIKEAEEKHNKPIPALTLNKQAAHRVILHSLAGNTNATTIAERAKALKEQIMAKRKSLPQSPPVTVQAPEPTPQPQAIEAVELLESISKEIEMEDQEGSEEGEIDEEAPGYQPSLPVPVSAQPLQNGHQVSSKSKKRKHNNSQPSKLSAEQKADKKARKKSKKETKKAS